MLRALGSAQQPILGFAEGALAPFKPLPKPHIPAEGFEPMQPTSPADIDTIVQGLSKRAEIWAGTSPKDRATILRRCISTTLEVASDAATAVTKHKGSYGYGIAEEL